MFKKDISYITIKYKESIQFFKSCTVMKTSFLIRNHKYMTISINEKIVFSKKNFFCFFNIGYYESFVSKYFYLLLKCLKHFPLPHIITLINYNISILKCEFLL